MVRLTGVEPAVPELDAPGGRCARHSREAPYKREAAAPNEDACFHRAIGEEAAVFAVADGVGGHAHGEAASALAVQCLGEALDAPGVDPTNLREPILDAIERCNRELLEEGRGSATTLVVVELQGDVIRPYHVGDSSIMVIGREGRLRFRSIAHSPIGYGIEAGLLDEDAAIDHAERHWLSNLVGSAEMRIEVGAPLTLGPRDTLLLCSDALTDNLATEAIADTARRAPLGVAAARLVAACERAMAGESGHPDDLTLLLYRRHRAPAGGDTSGGAGR